MNYLSELKNKKILITGASAGIGMACAKYFGELGASLYLVARRENVLKDLVTQYQGEYLAGDINDQNFRQQMQEAGYFKADIFINNLLTHKRM